MLANTSASISSTTNWFANGPRRVTAQINTTGTSLTVTAGDGNGKLPNGYRLYRYNTATAMVACGIISSNTAANSDGTGTYTLTASTAAFTSQPILAVEATAASAPTTGDMCYVTTNASLAQSVAMNTTVSRTIYGLSIVDTTDNTGTKRPVTLTLGSADILTLQAGGLSIVTTVSSKIAGTATSSAILVSTACSITVPTASLTCSVTVDAGGGNTVTFSGGITTTAPISIVSGNITFNGNLTCNTFSQTGGVLTMGSNTVTCSGGSGTATLTVTGGTRPSGNLSVTFSSTGTTGTRTVNVTTGDVVLYINTLADTVNLANFIGVSIDGVVSGSGKMTGTLATAALPSFISSTTTSALVWSPQANNTLPFILYSLGLNLSKSGITTIADTARTLASLTISAGTFNISSITITSPSLNMTGGTISATSGGITLTGASGTVISVTGGTIPSGFVFNCNGAGSAARTYTSSIAINVKASGNGSAIIYGPFIGSLDLSVFSGYLNGSFTLSNITFGSAFAGFVVGTGVVTFTSSITFSPPSAVTIDQCVLTGGTLFLNTNSRTTTFNTLTFSGGNINYSVNPVVVYTAVINNSTYFANILVCTDLKINNTVSLTFYTGGYTVLNPSNSLTLAANVAFTLPNDMSFYSLSLFAGATISYGSYTLTYSDLTLNGTITFTLSSNITLTSLTLAASSVVTFVYNSYKITTTTMNIGGYVSFTLPASSQITITNLVANTGSTTTLPANRSISGTVTVNAGATIVYAGYTFTSATLSNSGILDCSAAYSKHILTGTNTTVYSGNGNQYSGGIYLSGNPTTGTRTIIPGSNPLYFYLDSGSDTVSISNSFQFVAGFDSTNYNGVIAGTLQVVSTGFAIFGNNCNVGGLTLILTGATLTIPSGKVFGNITVGYAVGTTILLSSDLTTSGILSFVSHLNLNGFYLKCNTISYTYTFVTNIFFNSGTLEITSGNFQNGGDPNYYSSSGGD